LAQNQGNVSEWSDMSTCIWYRSNICHTVQSDLAW